MFHLERAGGQCFTNISCLRWINEQKLSSSSSMAWWGAGNDPEAFGQGGLRSPECFVSFSNFFCTITAITYFIDWFCNIIDQFPWREGGSVISVHSTLRPKSVGWGGAVVRSAAVLHAHQCSPPPLLLICGGGGEYSTQRTHLCWVDRDRLEWSFCPRFYKWPAMWNGPSMPYPPGHMLPLT